jgi:hypothetical protein
MIAAIKLRRVIWLILANQHARDSRSKPTEDYALGIHYEPILSNL